ncbi:MAG: hypothetical protein DDT32_01098 [Syntrophomonadaceae bacterium]|nr:hypothetical protein [Bacillota bacterium]MBT9147344.1 hypothetical protein [Bacillota bacterium]
MSAFDWSKASETLADFGGTPITLHVPKTSLPFYDALQLYGAIDLYIGLREDVSIHDAGAYWKIQGRSRENLFRGKDISAFKQVWEKKKPLAEDFCSRLRSSLVNGAVFQDKFSAPAKGAFVGLDAVLKSGIRGVSAASYDTLRSGETSKRACLADIPLSQGLLAFAGKKRTENIADIMFLPVFEGKIDLSKVVSPLLIRLNRSNATCAQALMLLALKTSLFGEGYQDRLTAVVYNTDFDSRKNFNYSGLIEIGSTAIGKMKSCALVSRTYETFRNLVKRAWTSQGQSTELTPDALAMAYWLLQPLGKHLSSMITSQERLRRGTRGGDSYIRQPTLFDQRGQNDVKEVFSMSYGDWQGDYEAVRKLARAVASSIYHARMKREEDPGKNWYDEVVMLRSAPGPKAFIGRAMILIEQGHREQRQIGTVHRNEDFDPKALLTSVGTDSTSFETFRDLFRMYLVQESTYKTEGETIPETEGYPEITEEEITEGGKE